MPKWGSEMTPLVKCLPGKLKDMDPISSSYIKSWAWWHMLAIPALNKWRRSNLWGSLASQPRPACKVPERPSENIIGCARDGWCCQLRAFRITKKMTSEHAYEKFLDYVH